MEINLMAIMLIKLHFKNRIQSVYILFLFCQKCYIVIKKRSETVFPIDIVYNKF